MRRGPYWFPEQAAERWGVVPPLFKLDLHRTVLMSVFSLSPRRLRSVSSSLQSMDSNEKDLRYLGIVWCGRIKFSFELALRKHCFISVLHSKKYNNWFLCTITWINRKLFCIFSLIIINQHQATDCRQLADSSTRWCGGCDGRAVGVRSSRSLVEASRE